MSGRQFVNSYLGEFSSSGKRATAFDLWCAVLALSEEYDRTICTGVFEHSRDARPMSPDEAAACSRYARELYLAAELIALDDLGIDREDLLVGMAHAEELSLGSWRFHGERSGWTGVLRQVMRRRAIRAAQERGKRMRILVRA